MSNQTETGFTRDGKVARLAFGVGVGLMLLVMLVAPLGHWVLRFVPDDAFYYLEIARRIGSGQGSTFDGLTKTNGYHPLWQLLLVPLAPVMNASREFGARLVCALSVGLFAGAVLLLRRTVQKWQPKQSGFAEIVTWMPLLFAAIYGMESALAALLLSALFLSLATETLPASAANGLKIGLLGVLLVLARLDSLLYVGVLDAVWWFALSRSKSDKANTAQKGAFFACIAVQIVGLGSYFLYNQFVFGHLLTVSAMTKVGRQGGFNLAWAKSVMAILGVLSAVLAAVALRLSKEARFPLLLRTAAWGSLVAMAFIVLRGSYETYNWYFTLPIFCSGLFVASIAESLAQSKPALVKPFVAGMTGLVVAVLAVTILMRLKTKPEFEAQYQTAKWLSVNAPQTAVFTNSDCGILGYFSERSFVNADGLTNSFEFQDAIKSDTVPAWLTHTGVNSAVLPVGEPFTTCTGEQVSQVVLRKGMSGDLRRVFATLAPSGIGQPSDEIILWRLTRFSNGEAAEVDTCTRRNSSAK